MATWTLEQAFAGDAAEYCDMALDSSGYAHLVTTNTGGSKMYHIWDTAGGWQSEEITDVGGTYPQIVIDSSDIAHVLYNNPAQMEIGHNTRAGGAWGTPDIVDTDVSVKGDISATIDSSDVIHCAYRADLGAYDVLRYAYGTTGAWAAETADGDVSENRGLYNNIVVHTDGTVHMSYTRGASLGHAYGTTGSFTAEAVVAASIAETSIAIDSSGYAYISYYDATTDDMMYVAQGAGGWGVPETVDSTDDVGRYSSIVIDPWGVPHIAYHYATGAGWLKYASRAGGSWTAENVDTDADVGEFNAMILNLTTGEALIGYHDDGNEDVKLATAVVFLPYGQPMWKRATGVPGMRSWQPKNGIWR